MSLWDSFISSDLFLPATMAAGAGVGVAAGNPLAGAMLGGAIGSWLDQELTAPGGQVSPEFRTPEQQELIAERQDALRSLLEQTPTAEERFDVARGQLAGEASAANQAMVAGAARRGLLHSGILAAEKARLQRGLTEQATQARLEAERGETADRAAILQAIAADRPLPEVTLFEEDPSQARTGGLLGAGIGAIVGGPQGASAGYQIGSGLGQYATERARRPSRPATPVRPRWEDV